LTEDEIRKENQMGWGRYLLLGNIGQQLDLSDQKQEIDTLRNELRCSRVSSGGVNDVAQLREENDELRLYLTALVRLLTSKGVVTREELESIVAAVDAEDGRRDGRFTGPITRADKQAQEDTARPLANPEH
jgi:hypothetical protein